jgi:hypothetical protein
MSVIALVLLLFAATAGLRSSPLRRLREYCGRLITGGLGSAAECFIDGNYRYIDSGLSLRNGVFRVELCTLRVEQHQKIRNTFAILNVSKLSGAP